MQFLTWILLSFWICLNLLNTSNAMWMCTPCLTDEECNREPTDFCAWGKTINKCKRKVCAKGPGERCGGPYDTLGRCGSGLMCKIDGRCNGCSIYTYECYP